MTAPASPRCPLALDKRQEQECVEAGWRAIVGHFGPKNNVQRFSADEVRDHARATIAHALSLAAASRLDGLTVTIEEPGLEEIERAINSVLCPERVACGENPRPLFSQRLCFAAGLAYARANWKIVGKNVDSNEGQ